MKKNILLIIAIAFSISITAQVNYNNNSITGNNASAVGENNTASGDDSFVGGINSIAQGGYSFAFGNNAQALSHHSFALGGLTTAGGSSSFAIGKYCSANGASSFAIGSGINTSNILTNSTSYSLMIGFNSDKPTFFVGEASGAGTTGSIGIGDVTDPQAKLHIKGDSDEDADLLLEPISSMKYARIKFGTSGNTIDARGSLDLNFHTASDFIFWDANVGIGIYNPSEKLDVNGTIKSTGFKLIDGNQSSGKILQSDVDGNAGWVDPMTLNVDDGDWVFNGSSIYRLGNVSIGTTNLPAKLTVDGDILDMGSLTVGGIYPGSYKFSVNANAANWASVIHNTSTSGKGVLIKAGHIPNNPILQLTDNSGSVKFTVRPNGDVDAENMNLSGSLSVSQNVEMTFLTVSDKIEAGMIEVKEISKWQDDVFKPDYDLRSISETEQYIKKHGHLPEIPSETDVLENGYNVGEMDALLLQKIEELTLYVIELKKEINELKNR